MVPAWLGLRLLPEVVLSQEELGNSTALAWPLQCFKFLLHEQCPLSFSCLCAKVLPPGCSYPISVTIRRHFLLTYPRLVGSPLPYWLLPSSRSVKLAVLNPFSSKRGGCILPCISKSQLATSPCLSMGQGGFTRAGYSKNFGCMSQSRKKREAAGKRRGKYCQIPAGKPESRKSSERKGLEVKAGRKSPGP